MSDETEDKKLTVEERWFPVSTRMLTPAKAATVRGDELAPGGFLHSASGSETIIICMSCKKPLWVVHPIKILSQFTTEQRAATPIGHKANLEKQTKQKEPDFSCPLCGQNFAAYNGNLQTARYLTNKGLM